MIDTALEFLALALFIATTLLLAAIASGTI